MGVKNPSNAYLTVYRISQLTNDFTLEVSEISRLLYI